MGEPVSTSAAGITIGLGTVTITGSVLGAEWSLLVGGFAGGVIWLCVRPQMSKWKVASSIAISAVLAAYFAPIAVAWMASKNAWLLSVSVEVVRTAAAIAIGLGWQALLPSILEGLRSLVADGFGKLRSMFNTTGGNR